MEKKFPTSIFLILLYLAWNVIVSILSMYYSLDFWTSSILIIMILLFIGIRIRSKLARTFGIVFFIFYAAFSLFGIALGASLARSNFSLEFISGLSVLLNFFISVAIVWILISRKDFFDHKS